MSGSDTTTGILSLNRNVTVGFAVLTAVTHVAADALDRVYAVVASMLFGAGIALFVLGFWNGVQRSRHELVTMSGLLAVNIGNVTPAERRRVWWPFALQVVVAVVAASLRPFTAQAFALLVPILGIGLAVLWGSRNARLHLRDDD